jgi:hypothetical protein
VALVHLTAGAAQAGPSQGVSHRPPAAKERRMVVSRFTPASRAS